MGGHVDALLRSHESHPGGAKNKVSTALSQTCCFWQSVSRQGVM